MLCWNAEVIRIINQDEYAAGEPFLSTITIKRRFPSINLPKPIEDEITITIYKV